MRSRVLVAVLMLLWFAPPASAQYFGRNKVHYKQLDFQVLKTEHFDIYFYSRGSDGVEAAARMAERWHARLSRVLAHELRGRQPLVLYASHPDFEQTNIIPGEIGEGTGGVTEPLRRRIVLPLAGPLADTDHVIGHELVHAFQFDITTLPGMSAGETGAERLPLWFIEGMAEYLSIGPVDAHTAMWLRDAARQEELPTIDDLNSQKYFPYRWGQAFWAYVTGRWGDNVVATMLAIGARAGADGAIEQVLGLTSKQLSADWQAAIRAAYQSTLSNTTPPSDAGTRTIARDKLGSDLNVGPAISPDGRWLAFLSERGLFSVELYVADLQNNRIAKTLTRTATDPHYSSLQFIYSSGAWDAASRRLAVATVTSGRPALAIFDAVGGSPMREIELPELDEAFNPTWSPDGRELCFTGMTRGVTDLFIADVDSGRIRQLTRDAFAELQPAWSPDGQSIAIATDRFSSDLTTLAIGRYQIALVSPTTGEVRRWGGAALPGATINPQWSRDGRSLYVIGRANGIANLYRLDQNGAAAQLTDLQTGISGITATSPALSVATGAGLTAYSVYDNGRYDIYTSSLVDLAPREGSVVTGADRLPPVDRRSSVVRELLADASAGLPASARYETVPYKSRLRLEGLSQPTIGVGADRYGAAVGGGIAAYFGDELGHHMLVTGVQINSGISGSFSATDTAFQAAYLNQAHRWNWGVLGARTPYLSGFASESLATVNGEAAIVDQTVLFRQTEQSVGGMVAYPLNRSQRIEFQTGASRIGFDQVTRTQVVSIESGLLVGDDTRTERIASPLTLGTVSSALVYDTANLGATSPVSGQRYRFEVAPSFGSITNTSVLLDYRRYFMPVPLYTIAGRILHYGRYGSGGEDPRLFPLSIGYPNLVRGYDVNAIDVEECEPTAASNCPAFDRLVGSRMLVGNLEFRFPLLRPFRSVNSGVYGPLPVEVGLFLDGGVAWKRGDRPKLFDGAADGVASAGVTLRTNVFGFAVLQFDFARPFQRPGKGWVFQFNLAPGF